MGQRDRWMVPLGVLVPLILAVTTTSFTKRFGIGGGEWETAFVMLIAFTALWLIYALRVRGKAVSVDSIVDELCENPVEPRDPSAPAIFENVSDDEPQDISGTSAQAQRAASYPVTPLAQGDRVHHERFGLGTVLSTNGSGDDLDAFIEFGGSIGVKHLIIRYAPITKL